MILVSVLIEIKANYLNRPFIYFYQLKKKIEIGVRVVVPFKKRTVIGYVIDIKEVKDIKNFENLSGFKISPVIDVIDVFPILNKELFSLAKEISNYYLCSIISVLQIMLPPSLRPNSSSLKAPKIHYKKYLLINEDNIDINKFNLTLKQIAILNLIKEKKKILKSCIKSNSIIKKLLQNNLIKEVNFEEKRLKNVFCYEKNKKKLTLDQQKAVFDILNSKNKISLLEGVTGSGKTEVYLSLSKKIIESGKSVIILVPEIFLTNAMVKYFKESFNYEIAVFHSQLTSGEKYDEYRYIASGKIKLVIGARSAIFAPVLNLGLIIIDEEHSDNYKNNKSPFYDVHKVALMRKNNDCLVVFGSATPLLETKIKAIKGIYNHVKLTKRINNLPLPKTYIIDIQRLQQQKSLSIISDFLYEKIKEKISNKEQVILLMNRRGFSTSIVCNECHTFFKCPNCGILLVFHKEKNFLKCHSCNFFRKMIVNCDYCNSKNIAKLGIGIEKVEQELKKMFPNFSIARLDGDVTECKKSYLANKTIENFYNKKIDILLGTQMIAKSYDFSNVTLAAIILADIGFSLQSFKKNENIFTLIVQTIGRSGRANKQGEAIIQTFSPDHYIIKQACKQDYNAFFKNEMMERKINQYPPYVHIIVLIFKSKNKNIVDDMSKQIFNDLTEKKFKDTVILNPIIPHMPLENKKYLRKIVIKYKKNDDVKKYIKDNVMDFFAKKRSVFLSIDVDSFDF